MGVKRTALSANPRSQMAVYGSLLGLVRDGHPIPWTSDNDVGVLAADLRRISGSPSAAAAFASRGLALFVDGKDEVAWHCGRFVY